MKVTVYHNLSRDASFGLNTVFTSVGDSGYQKRQARSFTDQHPLVKVFEYDVDGPATDQELLDWAWVEFNIGGSPQAQEYRACRLRSLSVGDVVRVDDRFYSVESAGFKDRSPDELKVVTSLDEAESLVRSRYDFRPGEQLSVTVPLA